MLYILIEPDFGVYFHEKHVQNLNTITNDAFTNILPHQINMFFLLVCIHIQLRLCWYNRFTMSPSKKNIRRTKCDELIRRTDNLSKVLQMSKAMQTRFQLIPASALNNVTVAGIRDMSLGRVKNGKPVGMIVYFSNN